MLGGYKKKKKILKLAKEYVTNHEFNWWMYYKDMSRILK